MRVITWNCRRASRNHSLWGYFRELAPDVALLQKVGGIPVDIAAEYSLRTATPPTRSGRPQRFSSAFLVRGRIDREVVLLSSVAGGWLPATSMPVRRSTDGNRVRVEIGGGSTAWQTSGSSNAFASIAESSPPPSADPAPRTPIARSTTCLPRLPWLLASLPASRVTRREC